MKQRTYYDFGGKVWSITHDSEDTKGLVAKIYAIKHKIYQLRQDFHESIEIANPRDYLTQWYNRNYLVSLSPHNTYLVNAENEQEAIEEVIDYCVNRKYMGLFLDDEMIKEIESEGFLDDYYYISDSNVYLSEPGYPMIERVK